MSKSFASVTKPTQLGLQSVLPRGRLAGCRICDVISDDYEYLDWMNRNGYLRLDQTVLAKIQSLKAEADAEEYYQNEVAPWSQDDFGDVPW